MFYRYGLQLKYQIYDNAFTLTILLIKNTIKTVKIVKYYSNSK